MTEEIDIPQKKTKLTKAEKNELALQKMRALEKQIFRDSLKREIQYTNKSLRRGGEEWNGIVKRIRNKELMSEVMDWQKQAWRLFDRKNYSIRLLLQNIEIAEMQHERMFSTHVQLIDYLIEFCKTMIKIIKNLYEIEAYEMILNFYRENDERDKATDRFRKKYENLMHADNLITKNDIQNRQDIHTNKKEDIINDSIVHCYDLRDSTINKMNQLYGQLKIFFDDLEEDTINVRSKDEIIFALAKQKNYDIDLTNCKEATKTGLITIGNLQEKLTQTMIECQQKESKVMEEKQIQHLNFLHLRAKIKHYAELNDTQIKYLAKESYIIVEDLKKYVEYGKHLIGVAYSCRKYQTEAEKIIPWPKIQKQICVDIEKTKDESLAKIKSFEDNQEVIEQIEKIQNFLYRSACCENQCYILRREKKQLEEENQKYIELLKTCYEAIAYQKIMKHVKASDLLSTIKIEPRSSV